MGLSLGFCPVISFHLLLLLLIMAGIEPNEGVVLTRNRDITRNTWRLPNPIGQPWYVLQTNYVRIHSSCVVFVHVCLWFESATCSAVRPTPQDHWLPDPVHDARRTYGTAHMDKLGQTTGATMAGVMDVLSTWRKCALLPALTLQP